jgi:hypothetical protein
VGSVVVAVDVGADCRAGLLEGLEHRGMLDQAPTEIVVESGAELPIFPEPDQLRSPHPDTSGAVVFGVSEPEFGPGDAGADSPVKGNRGPG